MAAAEAAAVQSPEAAGADGGSFRDPAGHVFRRDGRILRRVNHVHAPHFDSLIASGLYDALVERELLVAHEEIAPVAGHEDAYRILAPRPIPFISYPFEWAFSQLRAAALTTLRIQRTAIEHGLTLKDASAYNIQFLGAQPVLIDTLSFESWNEGTPWIAYRQFCQQFLGPLALMSATDVRLGALSRVYIDGPPLDLIARLLPARTRFRPSLLMHLHLHAGAQSRHGDQALGERRATRAFTRRAMLGLVDSLESAVSSLRYHAAGTTWADYYGQTNYSEAAMEAKQRIVERMIGGAGARVVWDLGANTGVFSRIAAQQGAYAIAIDGDPAAVERAVVAGQQASERSILPLFMDLTNPTGPMGWAHQERSSLVDRGPADAVLALGLIHHLTLANQVPFAMSAAFFARTARDLIIEFVPATDSQVTAMLSRMPSAFTAEYAREAFERAYRRHFEVLNAEPIDGSQRWLFHMRRIEGVRR
jgi:hypothetical protein